MPRARVAFLGLVLSVCLILAAAGAPQAIYPQGKLFGVVWSPTEDGTGTGLFAGPQDPRAVRQSHERGPFSNCRGEQA